MQVYFKTLGPSGGMVDAADSKSAGSDIVRVRVSPWAPSKMTSYWFVSILCEQFMRVDKMVDKNGYQSLVKATTPTTHIIWWYL